MEIKYIIKNQEGKIYMRGQGYRNLVFSKNGKSFKSIKMLKAALKGMIKHNAEDYNGIYLEQMKKLIATWEIVAIEIVEKPMINEIANFMKEI